MLYDIQTVVELFPGIRDHYAMPIGFLTAEEKRVARAQIPKWDALLPNLRWKQHVQTYVLSMPSARSVKIHASRQRSHVTKPTTQPTKHSKRIVKCYEK